MSARRENEVSIFNVCNTFRTDDFSQRIIELEREQAKLLGRAYIVDYCCNKVFAVKAGNLLHPFFHLFKNGRIVIIHQVEY